MATNPLSNQIGNRNFLSPTGFKFTLAKFPKVTFFSNSTRIPEINLSTLPQSNYLKAIDVPGDQLTYGDFTLRFLVDENMENYMSIHNWLTGLGFPEVASQYENFITQNEIVDPKNAFCDGTLRILSSNYRDVALIKFKDLYPISLTSLEFEAQETDIRYFTAEVTFKYTVYTISKSDGTPYESR
jgi:hypothetical protein